MGAMPAFPKAVRPLPLIVTVPQKALLSSVASLPSISVAPTTRLNEMPTSLPGTERLPVIRAPRIQLKLPSTVMLPSSVTAPPVGPSPKRVTLLPENARSPV
jgi:hypothetical protein